MTNKADLLRHLLTQAGITILADANYDTCTMIRVTGTHALHIVEITQGHGLHRMSVNSTLTPGQLLITLPV
jgi:hypothetical protein